MLRIIALLALAPLAVTSAGCGTDERARAGTETGGDVTSNETSGTRIPDGVAAQYETMREEIAAAGGEAESGPWRIGYIVERAEAWFDGDRFREPDAGETHHIEILPIERETGRLVPNVPIRLEVIDSTGAVVDAEQLDPFYGRFFHYAQNFSIPEEGRYTLRATIEPPTFLRHGEEAEGPVLAEGAVVDFERVALMKR